MTDAITEHRIVRLEGMIKAQEQELEGLGTTVEHLTNTINTILIPTQGAHSRDLAKHADLCAESHDYIVGQKDVRVFAKNALGVIAAVIAATASVATVVMKIIEAKP